MYLSAKVDLGKYCNDKVKGKDKEIRKILPEMFKSGNLDSIDIKFEVGYWRKANHIHEWFVKNVQDGKDECQNSYVSRDDLIKLKELCEGILLDKKRAKKEMPTQEGFFFGGTKYDKYYFDGLRETIKIINKCLKLPEYWEFEYHSSW